MTHQRDIDGEVDYEDRDWDLVEFYPEDEVVGADGAPYLPPDDPNGA